jgi:shikimate kinase
LITLVGMPGAGKSTVGPALAQLLGWGFVDTDDLIGDAVGCNFADYIRTEGIEAARAVERDVVSRLRNASPEMVVAVGGGAVLDEDNRAVMQEIGPVVWLRAALPTLLDHVGDGDGRPLLAGGAQAALERLAAERTPIYEQVATVVVDVDGLDPNEIAVEIVKVLS